MWRPSGYLYTKLVQSRKCVPAPGIACTSQYARKDRKSTSSLWKIDECCCCCRCCCARRQRPLNSALSLASTTTTAVAAIRMVAKCLLCWRKDTVGVMHHRMKTQLETYLEKGVLRVCCKWQALNKTHRRRRRRRQNAHHRSGVSEKILENRVASLVNCQATTRPSPVKAEVSPIPPSIHAAAHLAQDMWIASGFQAGPIRPRDYQKTHATASSRRGYT